jgi:UDP-N-acetylmuramoyl-L-alanyl-D-glutamate--2,6-diaminopimelate ligase
LPVLQVEHGRRALAQASAAFFGHPERKLAATGITGTNGKTTTAFLTEALLNAAARSTVLIGTIEYHVAGESAALVHTTPESRDLFELMAEGAARGATELVTEVSSHGLDQGRMIGIELRCRRIHQSHARSSRLSPDDGELLCRQAPALRWHRVPGSARRGHECNGPRAEELAARCATPAPKFGRMESERRMARRELRCSRPGAEIESGNSCGFSARQSQLAGEVNILNLLAAFTPRMRAAFNVSASGRKPFPRSSPCRAAFSPCMQASPSP